MATNGGLNACVKASKIYDIVRIDHFRRFESYWKSLLVLETAAPGKWVKGPIQTLQPWRKSSVIWTSSLRTLASWQTESSNFVNALASQEWRFSIAFNPDDESIDSPHLAPNNSVMYTGTHDNNNTVLGWNRNEIDDPTLVSILLVIPTGKSTNLRTACYASHRLCFRQLHGDYYDARLARVRWLSSDELPSTLGGNWSWRMTADQLTPAVEQELLDFTTIYRRKQRLEKRSYESRKIIFPLLKNCWNKGDS